MGVRKHSEKAWTQAKDLYSEGWNIKSISEYLCISRTWLGTVAKIECWKIIELNKPSESSKPLFSVDEARAIARRINSDE